MRSQFSEKVDKYILSPALNNLIGDAQDLLLNRNAEVIYPTLQLSEINPPDFINLNTSVYVVNDSIKYHNDEISELSVVKFTPELTDDQITEYKKFLVEFYKCKYAKIKWLIANQLINIASMGSIGIHGVTAYNTKDSAYKTIGYKLYRVVDGLNSYYLNVKMCDLLELESLLDESKLDGNVAVKPITLDQVTNEISKLNLDLTEGSYYQQTGDDNDVFLEIEPWIDGIDTPWIVQVLLDLIKANTVVGGNFSAKARENIELALNKANEYMQSLPLNTKLTEIELIGQNIKKLLDIHDSIPLDSIGDRFSNEKVSIYKDVDPDKLFEDIVNFSKFTAKKFKEIYDSNSANNCSYFGGGDAVKECIIECKSGIDPNLFSTLYSNVNKLGLASYVAD